MVVVEAQVAVEKTTDEIDVLLPDRLVKTQSVRDEGDRLRRGLPAGERTRHVVGRDEEQRKDRQGDQPHHEDAEEDASNEKPEHDTTS